MAVLQFNKQALGNLEYSLQREVLSTNRAGGYMNTTIVCCNTRKYHGLMVCPVPELADEDDFVLLSSLDETVIQHEQEFNLAIHRFPGNFEPRGHKYIVDFSYTPTPTIIYRVGGVLLKKELLWVHTAEQLLVRYTLLEAKSETRLRLKPFLAFRSRHALSNANDVADGRTFPIENGVRAKLYEGYPWLNMQIYKTGTDDAKFTEAGNERVGWGEWYHNFEYIEEKRRGYDATEDLLTPGTFEMSISPGEYVIFSGSTEANHDPKMLAVVFAEEIARRSVKTEFLPALYHSARQFLIIRKDRTSLTAGYPWYSPRSRETFISLPGITLTQGLTEQCIEILDHHVKNRLKNGIFGTHFAADTQLWFFYTLQRLESKIDGGRGEIWTKYAAAMKEILNHYREGVSVNGEGKVVAGKGIHMSINGLIWAEEGQLALSWMNSLIDGWPVTQRAGFTVEINALWYNAVCYTLDLAREMGDQEFTDQWGELPELIRENFTSTFWLEARGNKPAYLADYVAHNGERNEDIRPNQIIACSLDYSPLGDMEKQQVMSIAESNLLTPRGLRTLSPSDPKYKGFCRGDTHLRHEARHQGTVYPWLLEHYVRGGLKLYGDSFKPKATELLYGFEEDLLNYGIGSVPEKYDADAPHEACGAISYAPSVAALLTIHELIK